MHKRLFALCFFVLLCLSCFNVCAEEDIFYIGRESDFVMLEEYPYGTFYLTCNIMFSEKFNPMFTKENNKFYGTLDGKGHTLSYLRIETDKQVAAFIGYNEGKILNLNLEKSSIVCSNEDALVGGLVAYNSGVIENCSFSGDIILNGKVCDGVDIAADNKGEIIEKTFEIETDISDDVSSKVSSFESFVTTSSISLESSSVFEMTNNDITSIITSLSNEESSAIKETSSKKKNESKTSSSEKNVSSDRIDSTEFSDSSNFLEAKEENGNVLSLILLGICISAVLFACGFVVYKEISYNKNKKAS